MAKVGGIRGGGGLGERTRSRDHVVQEFIPPSAWTEDSNGHCLLVDLPDFKKEEVKLQVDNSGQITVSGERLANNDKYIYFEQTYKIPDNADTDKITGKFDGEILYVTVPKQEIIEETKEPEENNVKENHSIEEDLNDNEPEDNDVKENHSIKEDLNDNEAGKHGRRSCLDGLHTPLDKAMEMIRKNKGILFVAVLAFSLGVLVTRNKLESVGE